MWDSANGRSLVTLTGHQSNVNAIAWSVDGRRIATGGADRLVKIWEPDKGSELFTLKGHSGNVWSVAWSPDGRRTRLSQ